MNAAERPWRALMAAIVLLVAVFALFESTGIDLAVQDRLFDFTKGEWLVDARDPLWRAVFYNGPKYVLIAAAVAMLVLALGPGRWRSKARLDRRGLAIALLTLSSVPAFAGFGKAHTNVFCPSEIRRYGGDVAYVKVLERFPSGEQPARRGRCFPAGHASGGFALIGLLWLRGSLAWRAGVVALSLGAGWWMGAYQMLKGAHYLGHTAFTMVLAGCIAVAWRCILPGVRRDGTPPPLFFTGKETGGT